MLAKFLDANTFNKNHTNLVIFTAKIYPFNFFKLFLNYLKKQQKIEYTSLYINSLSDWQACLPNLEMSFLGQKNYYWLHELALDTKNKQLVYKYLVNYQGPHTILFFINSDDYLIFNNTLDSKAQIAKTNLEVCDLSKQITNKEVLDLAHLIAGPNHLRVSNFIKKIQTQFKLQLDLEQVCILMQYALLVREPAELEATWLEQILNTDQSLFALSKHFLFRDSKLFYQAWSQLSTNYADQFWMMFFSEQIFRAYWFIVYQKAQDFRLAKQIGVRLPFEFMKSGWRYLDPKLLIQAHDFLYQVDYQLKNGGSELWLEAFFNKFFKSDF